MLLLLLLPRCCCQYLISSNFHKTPATSHPRPKSFNDAHTNRDYVSDIAKYGETTLPDTTARMLNVWWGSCRDQRISRLSIVTSLDENGVFRGICLYALFLFIGTKRGRYAENM